jgi:deoxyribodipyrimidine photo-lyase
MHIVWFKRDLRTFDHAPLSAAAQQGPILPLYIVEPDLWRQPDASARQWRFVRESLLELDRSLGELGGRLVVRVGEAVAVLEQLRQTHSIAGLWSHEETGNAWTFARDLAVAAWARANRIPWREFRQDGVIRRLASREGWAEHWASVMAGPCLPPPTDARLIPLASAPLPTEAELFMRPDPCPYAQPGGRKLGLERLTHFLAEDVRHYARGMSSPLTAEHSCSRLSPHIAWGTLSMREIVQALKQRQAQAPRGLSHSLAAFEARLAWQSHFMQKLESEPSLELTNLHPALRNTRQTVDERLLGAWASGQTGLPLIDACMRMLHATGWLNFRMRAMLASFACYHLWQPWRAAGLHLARLFIDYEPGIHWSQMQMQSGSTGINAFRIYNPIKQSYDHDPAGIFIRRWVPELANVPSEWIHEPWRMPPKLQQQYGCRIGQDYPVPIVDHEQSARIARERLHAAYRSEEARNVSRQVFAKHGSRKPRRPRTTPSSRQLGLFE